MKRKTLGIRKGEAATAVIVRKTQGNPKGEAIAALVVALPAQGSTALRDTHQEKIKSTRSRSDTDENKSWAKNLTNSLQSSNDVKWKVKKKRNKRKRQKTTSPVETVVPGIYSGKGGGANEPCETRTHDESGNSDTRQNLEVSCCRPRLNETNFWPIAELDGKADSNNVNNKVINPKETDDDHMKVSNVPSESKTLIGYKRKRRIKTCSDGVNENAIDSSAVSPKLIQKDSESLMVDQSAEAVMSNGSKHANGMECDESLEKKAHVASDGTLPVSLDLCVSGFGTAKLSKDVDLLSQQRFVPQSSRKKLLVLDVNGLLADIVSDPPDNYKPDTIISWKAVFKRPYCDDFLQFCFTRFDVGVWSSRTERNVELILDFLLGNAKHKLLFCWNQAHCTQPPGYYCLENKNKPIILKKLKKLWEKCEPYGPDLPWEMGEYNESNTLLLDDSPYKALCNPPNTAIFPESYRYTDEKDRSLGPEGDLRVYLEGLSMAENVQKYVEENPFGQQPITKEHISWHYYVKVMEAGLSSPKHTNRYSSFTKKAN